MAGPGETIVVGAGTFDERLDVATEVTIRGLCPSMTTLTLSAVTDPEAGVVNVAGGALTLRDLRIGDTGAVGIASTTGTLTLSGVVIDGTTNHGISSTDSALTLTDVLVENVSPCESDSANGDGIYAYGGSLVAAGLGVSGTYRVGVWSEAGSLDISDMVAFDIRSEVSSGTRGGAIRHNSSLDAVVRRVAIDATHSYGIGSVTGSGDMTVEDLWLNDVGEDNTGNASGGLTQQGSGAFTVSGAVVQRVHAFGIDGFTGTMALEDVVVRDVYRPDYALQSYDSLRSGSGIRAYAATEVSVARAVVEDTEGDGVFLGPYLTEMAVAVEDAVVRNNGTWLGAGGYSGDTTFGSTGGGCGVFVGSAQATLDRVIIEDESRAGVYAMQLANVVATDVSISGAGSAVDAWTAPGVGVGTAAYFGGSLAFSRLFVDNAHTAGLDIVDAADATFTDVVIRDTQVHPLTGDGFPARAFSATGAPVSMQRAEISGGYGAGFAMQLVTADLQDVSISGIRSRSVDGRGGFGLESKYSDVTVARAGVADTQYAGIWANSGTIGLTDVLVSGVAAQSCASDSCPGDTAATGIFIGADPGNDVLGDLSVVVVDGADGVGLQVGAGAVTAAHLQLNGNGTGVDANGGTLGQTDVGFSANGANEASEAQPRPTLPWGVEVANGNAAGVDLGQPLTAGTYSAHSADIESTCESAWWAPYPGSGTLAWQGTTEFTFAQGYAILPLACVYDGTAVTCGGNVYTFYSDATTMVTLEVEQSNFRVTSATSFKMDETVNYSCTGDSCEGYPCAWSISEVWSQ